MSGPSSATVSTRFHVLSDTHNCEFENDTAIRLPFHLTVPKVEVLLHCGELTHYGGSSSYRGVLKIPGAVDSELKFVIAGNHDLDLDKRYWNTHLREESRPEDQLLVIKAVTGQPAAEAGVIYLDDGTYTFTLKNGPMLSVYASSYSPAFCDWAFAHDGANDRFNEAHQVANGVKSTAEQGRSIWRIEQRLRKSSIAKINLQRISRLG